MTTKTFVTWVEPIAARLRESRRKIVDVARSVPADSWQRESPIADWSYKDILCHLAAGDFFCQSVLTAVAERRDLDLRPLSATRDARNDRLNSERRGRMIGELIEEVEAEGAKTQELLSHLSESDESTQLYVSNRNPVPASLSDYLAMFTSHDEEHIRQLLTAAEGLHVA